MHADLPDLENGLPSNEAKARLAHYGPNEFQVKKEFSPVKLAISQFRSPLIYVLLFAGLVTLALGELMDAIIILLVVLSNALLGFWQEFKAAKSLEALKSYLKPVVFVRREGKREEILMSQVVPGDIVFLDPGGSVPADGLVISSEQLFANEALLTGESRQVSKESVSNYGLTLSDITVPTSQESKARHFVYMGTTINSGVGEMLVVRTGINTEMGKIANTLSTTQEELTPLQIKLAGLARSLLFVVIGVTTFIFAVGIFRGEHWLEMFETSVAVAVAAIPEGLAVSMTVILALGMQRIFKHKALVRKLVAAETLGSVSVICCDKTGTLTEGKMRIVGYEGTRDKIIRAAIFANDERDEEGIAMSAWASRQMAKDPVRWTKLTSVKDIRHKMPRIASIPFDSKYKYMASINQTKKGSVVSVVGAPEVVLNLTELSNDEKNRILNQVQEEARKGHRLIGAGYKLLKKDEKFSKKSLKGLKWSGFISFQDPVRPNVRQALQAALRAGVHVKVITGDYKETAMAVFKHVLLEKGDLTESQIMTGEELRLIDEKALLNRIDDVVLFARTSPDQKLKIVQTLKRKGYVVAMTGDGVNDAPALKASDIGVVVNEATDVSKQTADMVLLDSNFGTIVAAIREGRAIYETMRKVVTFLLTDVFQELILICGALMFGLPLPVTAVQILWINLIKDSFLSVALAFDSSDEGVMKEKPRDRDGAILDGEMRSLIFVSGIVSNIVLFGLFAYLLQRNLPLEEIQTLMFLAMSTSSSLYVFSIKSLKKNIWHENLLDNKFLIVGVFVTFILSFMTIYTPVFWKLLGTVPLDSYEIIIIIALALLTITMIEGVKWIHNNSHKRTRRS